MCYVLVEINVTHYDCALWSASVYLSVLGTCGYCIAQFIDGGNIGGLASFRNLTGKILTDSMLDNIIY